jgi:hypothetical protein
VKRVRFGIRLGWPIQNAATFVIVCGPDRAEELVKTVEQLRVVLSLVMRGDIAERLFCELS